MPRGRRGPREDSSSNGRSAVPGASQYGRDKLVMQALITHMEQPVAIVDDERRLMFFNDAADRMTRQVMGRGLEIDRRIDEYLIEEARPIFADAIERALAGTPHELTIDMAELGEAASWREYRFRPVRAGGQDAVYVSAVDIAAQHWADEQFSAIFEAAPIPMAILDAKARFRQVNDAYCERLGYRREDVISRPVSMLVPPDRRADVAEQYRKFAAGTLGVPTNSEFPHTRWFSRERRYLSADGDAHWADVARVAIRQSDGTLDYMLVMLLDTTEYKLTQYDLEKEKARTQAIFETAVDGIITVNSLGVIQQFNRAAEEIFGYRADEIIGKSVTILMPSSRRAEADAYLEHQALDRLESLVGIGGEFEAVRKDGTVFPIYLSVGAMQIEEEHKYAGIVRDLTRQKALEQRVRRSERMEALGQLAGGIAHDFNNVLTIVNSYVHTGMAALEEGSDPRFYLEKIRSAAERGARLTRQLLTFSPEQIGQPQTLDLNEVVRGLESLIGSVIEEDIELEVSTRGDVPPIIADRGQIEQVLMNLVVNARDAMPQGGELHIRTRLEHVGPDHRAVQTSTNFEPCDCAMLQVSDTGQGMDQETISRIFEPFFTTKPEGKGTGLGLATVYGIVQRYGGEILVDSALGQGTSFSIYFPPTQDEVERQVERRSSLPETKDEEDSKPAKSAATETILVVEDERDVREPLCMVLEAEGYTVLEAANGEEALDIVNSHPDKIDLVLTDVVMPGVTGIELASCLRDQFPGIQAVLVSGYSGDVLERKDIDAQQVRVSKPYDLDDLLHMLRKMLDDK